MSGREQSSSSSHPNAQLSPLAPRSSHPQSAHRQRTAESGSGRLPRLSHRSRAGCWTCRARKVKCDEIHPTCGPCSRLNRACDWDHRWNFSDATTSTQIKHSNVTTSGNAVWDPQARQSPTPSPILPQYDNMPAFSTLTSDVERERKAEMQTPGTFGVVLTPESFADLPEYSSASWPASRRASIQSVGSTLSQHRSAQGQALSRIQTLPNVVILDRFEDVPIVSPGFHHSPQDARRQSLPGRIRNLSLSMAPPQAHIMPHTSPVTYTPSMVDPFVSHFRRYILPRLIQPQDDDTPGALLANTTRDMFEMEARRFPPLHQAICALSALNMSYSGAASVDSAHLHYGQALAPLTTATSEDELLTNGAFLRHFLLFLYDICIPLQHDDSATNMWGIHLDHLQRIAVLRNERLGRETYGYVIWVLCVLDVNACLLGSGNCSFVRTILQHDMMPSLEQQIPSTTSTMSTPYLSNEVSIFPAILGLRQSMLLQLAKIAQVAQSFRLEASGRSSVSPGSYARWQVTTGQLLADLRLAWGQAYPPFLGPESPQAGWDLPPRPRYVFEQAYLLYQTATLYLRTSMFSRQRRIPTANQADLLTDTETRIRAIISLVSSILEAGHYEHRHVIFPLFMAAYATTQSDVKVQALDIMKAFEGRGIGQNTYTTRRLLLAVFEEQRAVVETGAGSMEDVNWLHIARERGLTVVNCGL